MEKKSFKKHGNEGSLLNSSKSQPTVGVSWKEWKLKRKEDYNKWKKLKKAKNQNKIEANHQPKVKALENPSEVVLVESKKPKNYTISIAVPGSVLDNAQSPELKTYLAGQIARAAAVFNVNEVVVFTETVFEDTNDDGERLLLKKNRGCTQLVRILQYLECPQYLRKFYFPLHKDFKYAGLLNPLDIPHHLRADEESEYREGIVLDKPVKEGKGSYVNIGLKKTAIIDKILETNVRVTVRLDKEQTSKKHFKGKAVSPSAPFEKENIYWGYNVRLAKGLNSVLSECPYKGGYDLTVGTSDKGQDVDSVKLPGFRHLLVVFGGLRGLESCLAEDESIAAAEPGAFFNFYVNTCPSQGSRTIRTEEAILITMSALRPLISRN